MSVAAAAESAIKSESLASLGVCLCTPSVRKLSADEGTQRKDMIQVDEESVKLKLPIKDHKIFLVCVNLIA